ncbi:hypothetical protein QFZ96_002516 [Paraburkholderia youngii]
MFIIMAVLIGNWEHSQTQYSYDLSARLGTHGEMKKPRLYPTDVSDEQWYFAAPYADLDEQGPTTVLLRAARGAQRIALDCESG